MNTTRFDRSPCPAWAKLGVASRRLWAPAVRGVGPAEPRVVLGYRVVRVLEWLELEHATAPNARAPAMASIPTARVRFDEDGPNDMSFLPARASSPRTNSSRHEPLPCPKERRS